MSEKRFTETERACYYTTLVFDNQTQEKLGTDKVVVLLNEQQATIKKLQDLCGESDGENAKLRIENKKLKEMDEQLREINKEFGDDLHNCRLNKNIISEKLKVWQDVHKEYDIYSIKDFEELLNGLKKENKQLKCINDQLEERLENSGIGIALKMDCDKDE